MVNTTNNNSSKVYVPAAFIANPSAHKTALNAWAVKQGLASHQQITIGAGKNPNCQVTANATSAAGKRKQALLNNAMVGKTVGQYYTQAKTKVKGNILANNILQAAKQNLCTLYVVKK